MFVFFFWKQTNGHDFKATPIQMCSLYGSIHTRHGRHLRESWGGLFVIYAPRQMFYISYLPFFMFRHDSPKGLRFSY